MRNRFHSALWRLALLPVVAPVLQAQPVVSDVAPIINTLGGEASYASSINNNGVIVGMAVDGLGRSRAFSATSGGAMTDLGTFGGPNAIAYGINDSGVIVGSAQNSSGQYQAFRYSSGVLTNINPFLSDSSTAYGINSSDEIVGYGHADSVNINTPFVLSGGLVTSIPNLGGENGVAFGINSSGVVVGRSQTSGGIYHAFSYNGTTADEHVFGYDSSVLYGANASGEMVGTAFDGTLGVHSAIVITETLTYFLGLGGNHSYAYSINDAGDVVGYSQNALGQERAFLYSDGTIYDLEALADAAGFLVPYGDGIPGFISFRTNRELGISINDYGEIVGYGQYYDGFVTVYDRAFYMQVSFAAIPEPSTYAVLIGVAALGLTLCRRRRAA